MPACTTWLHLLHEAVAAADLEQVFSHYFTTASQAGQPLARDEQLLAINGKLMHYVTLAERSRGVHLLAVYLPANGVVLAQVPVERKENKIVVAPRLRRSVTLSEAVDRPAWLQNRT